MGQFILRFMVFSFDLILMVRSAALESSAVWTQKIKGLRCVGVLKVADK